MSGVGCGAGAGGVRQATVGSGARLIDVYTGLNAQGVSIAARLVRHGGHRRADAGRGPGVVGRLHGLTCDQLDRRRAGRWPTAPPGRCSTADDPDLFWACQGGGGGNFGIATSFSYRTFAVGDVCTFAVVFPWAAAPTCCRPGWPGRPTPPTSCWANCVLLVNPTTQPTRPLVQVAGVVRRIGLVGHGPDRPVRVGGGRRARCRRGSTHHPGPRHVHRGGLRPASARPSATCPTQTAGGQLTRLAAMAKSQYVTGALSPATVSTLVAGLNERQGAAGGHRERRRLRRLRGRHQPGGAGATAFVHRNTSGLRPVHRLDRGGRARRHHRGQPGLAGRDRRVACTTTCPARRTRTTSTRPGRLEAAYYGSNLARLQQVKQSVDPDDFFHFAQSIPPA